MAEEFAPASIRITKAELISYTEKSQDIIPLIVSVQISQSMSSSRWVGTMQVLDHVGLLETWPLRGEEKLNLSLIGDDLGTEVDLECQVLVVDNVQPAENGTGLFYRIMFVSRLTYLSGLKNDIEPHSKVLASEAAKKVFDKHYANTIDPVETDTLTKNETLAFDTKKFNISNHKNKKLYIQKSEGQIKAIIPNLDPASSMDFLASRCYSPNSPSSSFRFFETLRNFYFVTDEFLVKRAIDNPTQIKPFKYGAYTTQLPNEPLAQIETLFTMNNDRRIDTGSDILNGGYRNSAFEIDIVRRTAKYRHFNYLEKGGYLDMEGKVRKVQDDLHSEEYLKDSSVFSSENGFEFLIFRDYQQSGAIPGSLRSDQYFTEITSNKISYRHHLNKLIVSASCAGRLDIEPGMVVNVEAREMGAQRELKENQKLSGNYLVFGTSHDIQAGNCSTSLSLVKYG